MTVANLLELPTLSSASVLAGVSGLERRTWNVGVIAGTEITEWVKPGAMILSTGHPFTESTTALSNTVRELAARGVSCLAIRPGRYNFRFTNEMIYTADELGFPLISLADRFAFDDILVDVLSKINLALRSEADFVERVHQVTTDVVMEGGSLESLIQNMASLLSANVSVFDPRGAPLADAGDTSRTKPSWNTLEETSLEIGTLHELTHNIRLRLGSSQTPLGFLECQRDSAAFGPTELRAAERAATVVALALAQRSAVRAVESNFQREVLSRVLSGELSGAKEISRRFRDIGWNISAPLIVGLAGIPLNPEDIRSSGKLEAATSWLHVFALPIAQVGLREVDAEAIAVVIGLDLIVVTSATNASQLQAIFRRIVNAFRRQASRGLNGHLEVGISAKISDLNFIRTGFQQAQIAARAGGYQKLSDRVTVFDDLGALGVVLAATTDPAYDEFHPQTLVALEALPSQERKELIATLRVIMRNNLNLAEAARTLHCHYNTIRRRVNRLEQLLGPFTTDADTKFAIELALRLRDFKHDYHC